MAPPSWDTPPQPHSHLCARGSQAQAAWNPSLPRLAGNRKEEEGRSESRQPLPPLTSTAHPESVTQSVGAPHIRAHTHLLALTHICLAQMRSVSPDTLGYWQMHRRFAWPRSRMHNEHVQTPRLSNDEKDTRNPFPEFVFICVPRSVSSL